MRMQTLTRRKMSIGISQKIDNIIFEWYTERGMEVPKWKYTKDPEWWIEYLQEIENKVYKIIYFKTYLIVME